MKERLFKEQSFLFVSSKLILIVKALCDEYLLRWMTLYYIININTHLIIKITQLGPDMHQRELTFEQKKRTLKS